MDAGLARPRWGLAEFWRGMENSFTSDLDFPCRLMAESDLKVALKKMQLRYGCRLSAATLGPGGVLAWDGKQFHFRSGFSMPINGRKRFEGSSQENATPLWMPA